MVRKLPATRPVVRELPGTSEDGARPADVVTMGVMRHTGENLSTSSMMDTS
jgi:hypothetical protein